MKNQFVHFELQADDVERAKAFYERLFDWRIEALDAPDFEGYYAIMTGDEDALNGGMMERSDPPLPPTFFVAVASLDDTLTKAKDMGADIVVPRMPVAEMGWMAVIKDPEGNILGLWEENPEAS